MRKRMKSVAVTLLMIGVLVSMFAFAPAAAAAEEPTLELDVTVSLTDHPADFSEDYTIVIEAEDEENPLPAGASDGVYKEAVSGSDTTALETIKYTYPGIYKYRVYQQAGSADRWTYDDTVYEVVVYATNKEDGSEGLDINAAIRKEGEKEKTEIVFVNVYDPIPVVLEVNATKTMDGKTPENGAFTFEIAGADGVIETVSNTDAVVSFSDIVLDEIGVHKFVIYEVKGTDKNITYDKTKYTVIATVTQDGDLVADITYEKNGKEYDGELIFKNKTYIPPLGDNSNMGLWIGIFAGSAVVIVLLLVLGKKKNKGE